MSMIETDRSKVLAELERVVVASVAVTARALADVAPELTFAQWRVLVLVDAPDAVGVGAIASALGTKIAATSRLVGRLRAHDLVATERSADDARVVLVRLTVDGRNVRSRVVERRRIDLGRAVAHADVPRDAAAVLTSLATALETTA
jgi:DNA-binding MarR family transcriptional regulator